jgi:hypothetical protein
MNIAAVKRMTVPEFLAWAETQEKGHYELIRGEIVAMAPERAEHVRAKQRAFTRLRLRFDGPGSPVRLSSMDLPWWSTMRRATNRTPSSTAGIRSPMEC